MQAQRPLMLCCSALSLRRQSVKLLIHDVHFISSLMDHWWPLSSPRACRGRASNDWHTDEGGTLLLGTSVRERTGSFKNAAVSASADRC